jgi:transposase
MNVKQEMILRYFREGHSQRKISRDLGLSRKTVKRYVAPYAATLKDQEENEPEDFVEELTKSPSYDISNRKSYKLTPSLKADIKRLLEINRERRLSGRRKQQYKKIDIWEHLKKAGYSIGYSTICKVISEYENESREAFIRQRYSPGDICEFDWGEVKIDTGNGLERYQIAVFTSGYSNYRYACLFKSQDTSSFQQAHVYFFEKIDGVYKEMVYDNMKVAVKRFVGPTEKEATVGLLKMATYYNFSYRFCNVRKGNEKGHVERSVEFVRRKAFAIKDNFSNLEDANMYLENICDELNSKPQKAFDGKSYTDLFNEEKPYLFATKQAFDCSEVHSLKVDKYSTVSFNTARYSVPDNLVGKMITARIYPQKIVISYDDKMICKHKRLTGLFKWSIKIEHYTKTLKRKPGALKGSEVLYQSTDELKNIYNEYFHNTPKKFIELIEYMSLKNISSKHLRELILSLNIKNEDDSLLDKIKIVFENKEEAKNAINQPLVTSEIEEMCTAQLHEYSDLFNDKEDFEQKLVEAI